MECEVSSTGKDWNEQGRTTTLLKTLVMIRGLAQIPTQPRSHGLFHAFTQSLIPNESREHVIVTLYTITSITSINKYLLKGFFPLLHCRTIKYHTLTFSSV